MDEWRPLKEHVITAEWMVVVSLLMVEEKVGLKYSVHSYLLCKHSLRARGLALHNEDY